MIHGLMLLHISRCRSTRTGKTCVATAKIDVLLRANQAQNVLFLADRDALSIRPRRMVSKPIEAQSDQRESLLHGKQGKMTLGATEFLRRFFLHVLPKGFVRIRHFGFLANRFRASRLALGRQLLASNRSMPEEVTAHEFRSESSSLWHYTRCGASMMVIQRFTAAELSACMYFDSS
jgi:putative transposase